MVLVSKSAIFMTTISWTSASEALVKVNSAPGRDHVRGRPRTSSPGRSPRSFRIPASPPVDGTGGKHQTGGDYQCCSSS